jgi:hypothetical protein
MMADEARMVECNADWAVGFGAGELETNNAYIHIFTLI